MVTIFSGKKSQKSFSYALLPVLTYQKPKIEKSIIFHISDMIFVELGCNYSTLFLPDFTLCLEHFMTIAPLKLTEIQN